MIDLVISRTFIERFHRAPAPRYETAYVAKVRHEPLRNQDTSAKLRWHESKRDTIEQPL